MNRLQRLIDRIIDLLFAEPSMPEPEEDRIMPSGRVVRRKIGDCPFYDVEDDPAPPRCNGYCHRQRTDGTFSCAYYDENEEDPRVA